MFLCAIKNNSFNYFMQYHFINLIMRFFIIIHRNIFRKNILHFTTFIIVSGIETFPRIQTIFNNNIEDFTRKHNNKIKLSCVYYTLTRNFVKINR